MNHAEKVGRQILEKTSVGFFDRLIYSIGEFVIYGPLKNMLGFNKSKDCLHCG